MGIPKYSLIDNIFHTKAEHDVIKIYQGLPELVCVQMLEYHFKSTKTLELILKHNVTQKAYCLSRANL